VKGALLQRPLLLQMVTALSLGSMVSHMLVAVILYVLLPGEKPRRRQNSSSYGYDHCCDLGVKFNKSTPNMST
jgi:hypothetical protein